MTSAPFGENDPFPPLDHKPVSSRDSALNLHAQSAALRLNAPRSLISLLDGFYQYILAEAGPNTPIDVQADTATPNSLWLGNVTIPRNEGFCEAILTSKGENDEFFLVKDLSKDEKFHNARAVTHGPQWRFLAAFPLYGHKKAIIGDICVLDFQPRPGGLSKSEIAIMKGLSGSITHYLGTLKAAHDQNTAKRMMKSLFRFRAGVDADARRQGSFNQSLSASEGSGESELSTQHRRRRAVGSKASSRSSFRTPSPNSGDDDDKTASFTSMSRAPRQRFRAPRADRQSDPLSTTREKSRAGSLSVSIEASSDHDKQYSQLQEEILPGGAKSLFSEAAHIIRKTNDLDGVVFLDAFIATVGVSQTKPDDSSDSAGNASIGRSRASSRSKIATSFGSSNLAFNTSQADIESRCSELGSSTSTYSNINSNQLDHGFDAFPSSILRRLLRAYPNGHIFNLGSAGSSEGTASSSEEQQHLVASVNEELRHTKNTRKRAHLKRFRAALSKLASNAKSIGFFPLWDYDRSRWFACGFFWIERDLRHLTEDTDMMFFRTFCTGIMSELSRLDAISSNRTKSTFVNSISHELRTPLHGILGGVAFLKGTETDAFHISMLNAINTSGRTLLDTLDNILDFTKANNAEKSGTAGPSRTELRGRTSMKSIAGPRSKGIGPAWAHSGPFNLAKVSEEVVESSCAAQSYRVGGFYFDDDLNLADPTPSSPVSSHSEPTQEPTQRSLTMTILQINNRCDRMVDLNGGMWRRILMHIFGNAMKFTTAGTIRVQLDLQDTEGSDEFTVTLKIIDTGIGMSMDFLANRAYTPFSQENVFSAGTGLGLTITRQLVHQLGGSVELDSEVGKGTTVTTEFTIPRLPPPEPGRERKTTVQQVRERLAGKKIAVLKGSEHGASDNWLQEQTMFAESLVETFRDWFGLEVTIVSDEAEEEEASIVICLEPSFKYLAHLISSTKGGEKPAITIFLALDAIEAATLRLDERVASKLSVVEIMPRP